MEENDKDYESVYAFLIDTKHVINTWNKSNHGDDINTLITIINDAINGKLANNV